jgi:parallel beta-helix repeat protein
MKKSAMTIVLILLLFIFPKMALAEDIAIISLNPLTANIFVGQTFSVNITVTNVTDLHGVNITLRYDTNVLDAVHYQLQPPWPDNHTGIYESYGYVWINSTLTSPEGINGTTTISQVTFKGTSESTTVLSLLNSDLLNSTDGQIAYIEKDGYVVVTLFKIRVPYDYPTIQGAINAANQSDTIFVYQGTYNEQISINKTITLLAENQNTTIDADNNGPAVNITAPGARLQGFTIRNGTIGINILSSGNAIQGNVAISDGTGMMITGTSDTFIANNTFTECTYGASFIQSSYDHMIGNRVGENNVGIYIENSTYTTIENIKIINNTNGIVIENSQNGKIVRNKILYNQNGMSITNSTSNLILRNNFDNTIQLIMQNSSGNTWDNGVEGNYWSDYNGTDTDGDGVGETDLPHQSVDNYPLVNPYFTGDVNHDGTVDSTDLGLLGLSWGKLPGEPNWNAACDLNEDESIDSSDLGWMGINWGKSL